jgi:uncharacterized repeat protein (TIGR04138 family)
MDDHGLVATIKGICGKDNRYAPGAYFFIIDALDYTARALNRGGKEGAARHVSGQELSEGVRKFALQQFGPMALTVLRTWGVRRTEDFGELVYNLIESGKLGRTDTDRKEDFASGYDFEEAFATPFLPKGDKAGTAPRARRKRQPPAPEKGSAQ